MAMVRCILGKFLGVACHCFIIVKKNFVNFNRNFKRIFVHEKYSLNSEILLPGNDLIIQVICH